MNCFVRLTLVVAMALLTAAPASAQLYSEGFDDSSADVRIDGQPDTATQFVDYSSLTVGAENFSIPEAPRMVGGSAATSGVLIQTNLTSGTTAGVNVFAGATPQTFSGNYKVSFDAWINVADPPPSGGTEQLIWGIGNADDGDLELRNTRATADGIWGWLAGENGYGTEDTAVFVDNVEAFDLGDTQPGERFKFNRAFTTNFGLNNAPANSWVQVDIVHDGGSTNVNFNGVRFFTVPASAPDGAAILGYEDPFTSISAAPDFQWGLFDNFVVTSVPEPSSLLLLSITGLGLAGTRRRS